MRGKAQHQKYGKFNKNTAKKAFANKKNAKVQLHNHIN